MKENELHPIIKDLMSYCETMSLKETIGNFDKGFNYAFYQMQCKLLNLNRMLQVNPNKFNINEVVK
ncbi:MAG: hypothetical protein IJZ29_05325 [Clostridia bacterium]|nr:hypothetical protein [Clostridia bacterium]